MDAGFVKQHRVRHTSSLYDFVKIRVRLQGPPGSGAEHSHVLSRFLLSRTLTASKVPYESAVKVALEVKKWLVDNDLLDIPQPRLEAAVFRFLRQRGFGEEYVQRYKLLSAFHQSRRPLLLVVCGSVLCHKTVVSAHLAQRLNFSPPLQTDWVYRLQHPDASRGFPRWGE